MSNALKKYVIHTIMYRKHHVFFLYYTTMPSLIIPTCICTIRLQDITISVIWEALCWIAQSLLKNI